MSDYTGLLTGNYYFQLNTGNGFLEATNDKTINVSNPDPNYSYSYPHGLKRESIDNLFGAGCSGFRSEFAIGADILRITKGDCEFYQGGFSSDGTRCIVWDQNNNFLVGASASNVVTNGACNSVAIGAVNTLCNTQNSRILGNTSSICGANDSTLLGYNNNVNGGYGIFINGNNNNSCNTQDGVIFQYNNTSNGGYGNFVNGNNNVVCSQFGHFNATILAGSNNQVYGALNTVLGGQYGKIGADANQVNETYEHYSLIGNGLCNYILGVNSTIINGRCNTNIGHHNFIGGGYFNSINVTNYDLFNDPGDFDYIQDIIPRGNFIGNGYYNSILNKSTSSAILGGCNNTISDSSCSAILNGANNTITGVPNSFIIGSKSNIDNIAYQLSGDVFAKLEGIGIINDGTTLINNYYMPRTLALGFRYGTYHYPFVSLNNDPAPLMVDFTQEVKEYNSGYFGAISGEYNDYSGFAVAPGSLNFPWSYYHRVKMVNLGTNNQTKFHAIDISGFISGANNTRKLYRAYNPSVLIGANNNGGHQNILIGVNNRSVFTAVEDINTGIYGPAAPGLTLPNVKTLNKGPWPFYSATWPLYQGYNTLIGHTNFVTGAGTSVLGHNNTALENAGPTLLLGNVNNLLPESGVILTGDGGYMLTFSGINDTGYFPTWKRNTAMIGFWNTERFGLNSNVLGAKNSTKTHTSNTIGYDNSADGAFLNSLGRGNINYGESNSTFGNNNIIDSGNNNTIVGINNAAYRFGTGSFVPLDNHLFGNSNISIGTNGILLGLRNKFGIGTGFYFYDSVLVGNNNIAENTLTTAIGFYNYTSGFNSSTLGSNNQISGGSHNGIFGFNNINFGTNAYSIGSNNKVYNEGGVAIGNQAFSYNKNQVSIAGGSNGTSWPGSSQKTHLFWKGITSGVANTELMLDGVFSDGSYVSGKAFIPSGVIWNGTVNIIASETGLSNALVQTRLVSAANRAGTMHLINNSVLNSNTTGTAAWGLGISMDSTYKALRMTATGSASKVIYWSVIGEFNETFVPTSEAITVDRYLNNTIVAQALQGTPDSSISTIEAGYPKSPNRPINNRGSYLPS
jgi:hypothetical protein